MTFLRFAGSSESENQFGIAEYGDVRIVRREDELPPPLLLPHDRHHAFCDKAVVEIVFGLINNEGRFGFEQQKQQHGCRLLPGRECFQRLPHRRLSVWGGVQLYLGCRRKLQLFDSHEQLKFRLSNFFCRSHGKVVVLHERPFSFPATLREIG